MNFPTSESCNKHSISNLSRIKSDQWLVLFYIFISTILIFLPTGFEKRDAMKSIRCRGRVLDIDNTNLHQLGMIKKGSQMVTLELLDGPFKGRQYEGSNQLMGQMSRDKIFKIGDTAFVVLSLNEDDKVIYVNPQEHYRLGAEFILAGLFVLLLILFGGWTGFKAILSFTFSILVLWKILIPLLLKGYDPVISSLAIVFLLNAAIIFIVAGTKKMGITAFLGACMGITTSSILARVFVKVVHIHGAVLPFSETLLYSGFGHLDITRIFTAAIFIAASGAVMDLAVDVAAALEEIVSKKPEISFLEAFKSGLFIGRAVVGTMTTTLLFAYSGGFITLLMAFMAQGIKVTSILNLVYVSAEVIKTLVGSFGLVTVAPFTALIGAMIYSHSYKKVDSSQSNSDNSIVSSDIIRSSAVSKL